LYSRLSGKTAKVSHVPVGMMNVMAPLMRPFQPVISRLMTLSIWVDTTDQTFDATSMLQEFPMKLTRVEDFIREQVKQ
jgi:hypothetical protein